MVAGINASIQFKNDSAYDIGTQTEKKIKDIHTETDSFNNFVVNKKIVFPYETVIGALAKYISNPNKDFQPMNANFGILPELETKIKDKKQRYEKMAKRSMENITKVLQEH